MIHLTSNTGIQIALKLVNLLHKMKHKLSTDLIVTIYASF